MIKMYVFEFRETITPGRDDPMPHMARWPLYLHR